MKTTMLLWAAMLLAAIGASLMAQVVPAGPPGLAPTPTIAAET
ncbi:MAG: hypothetical protein ACE15C_16120 [Phycisphaerae bacterium]